MTMHDKREMRRAEASDYLWTRWHLRYVPTTLGRLAVSGKGPVYHLRGRFAFYREEHLDAWAQSKISGPKRKAAEGVEARVP